MRELKKYLEFQFGVEVRKRVIKEIGMRVRLLCEQEHAGVSVREEKAKNIVVNNDLYTYGDQDSNNILIQPVDDHDMAVIEQEVAAIRKVTKDFCLIAVKVDNWNHDLSPWEAPHVFGDKGFGDGAKGMLDRILELTEDKTKKYYIGGYSLAGLFALWVAYQTDVFEGVAAASPSIWFPGFVDYMQCADIKAHRVYLSLGNREAKTKNPVMASVADRIHEAYDILSKQGIENVLEWNEGNHFREPELRMAKAFAWVLVQVSRCEN